ncbi:MAG: YlxR family protein, partial [Sphingomonas parapaucimobilis]
MRNRDNERGGVNDAPAKKGRSPRESAKAARDSIDGPVRRCILSGEHDARPHLIRLALAPDGRVLPDVRAKAPGRGGWIGVTRGELEAAIAKGKLKGALARAFKTGEFSIPDDLPDL